MISASAVTTRHELIMSLVAGLSLIMQGVKPNAQPPRIQVALATGKLVLPERGCLGQGGCEAKPDYDKVWKRAVMSPYASIGRPKASLPRPGSPCLR